ncbi:MAG TPA: MmcQ/YjbR family DNA-binding protein [Bryobacteraceae bacterium]|nr:MmcQ/YjbR family DNA-binding protein [Bryobacteraceae bacterium]
MNIDWLRRLAKALPHTAESVQWGNNLVFKVGGKIYAVAALEPGDVCLSLKCTPEEFAELTQQPGIIPAPYLARAHWIALEHEDALPAAEIRRLLKQSYELVLARLPKKARAALGGER